jgi:hexosaminidase
MLYRKVSQDQGSSAGHYTWQISIRLQLLLLLIVASFCLHLGAAEEELKSTSLNLMPWPVKVEITNGQFRLTENFYLGGEVKPGHRVFKAGARFMSRLAGRTGLFFEQDYLATQEISNRTKFFYHFDQPGRLVPGEDESYQLEIYPEKIELKAKTD